MAEPRQPAAPGTPRKGVSPMDNQYGGEHGIPPGTGEGDAKARPTNDRAATESAADRQDGPKED